MAASLAAASGPVSLLMITPFLVLSLIHISSTLQKSGLDYDSLKDRFPKLVMSQLDGYGEKGDEASRPGYDNTAFWARGGFLFSQSIYGDNEQAYPVYMPMGFGDVTLSLIHI